MGTPLAGQTVYVKKSDGSNVAALATDSNGNFSGSISLGASDTLTAVFTGSGPYNPSSSTPVSEQVNAPQQNTVVTLAANPNPGLQGQPITISGNLSTL